MAKSGPKPKPASKRKDRIIGVRVTAAEYRKFEQMAQKQHIPIAAWARAQIMLALDYATEKIANQSSLKAARREQDKKLTETKLLLRKTMRLYQSATTGGAEEEE